MSEDASKSGRANVAVIVAAVAALASLAASVFSFIASREATRIEQSLKLREFDFRMYEAVKAALSGGHKEQEVATALVAALGEDPLRANLLRAMEGSTLTDPEITERIRGVLAEPSQPPPAVAAEPVIEAPSPPADRSSMSAPQDRLTELAARLENWDLDLFYCEGYADGERAASQLADALTANGAQGRVRVRMLATAVNRRSSYLVEGWQIRRSADELPIAETIEDFAHEILDGAGFVQRPVRTATPYYISVFFCPDEMT